MVLTTAGEKTYESCIIKKAYFSKSNSMQVAKDWYESFVKYHFPKYAIKNTILDNKQETKFNFFCSNSELLTSNIFLTKHYTGELKRDVVSKISITDEVSHLGIKSVSTDKYVGEKESNILEIIPNKEIKSLLSFYKNVKPIADLVLLLTSFAERRRLHWYKCEGRIELNHIENYNTRRNFYHDKETTLLICRFEFENFLKNSLKNIELKDIKYITRLLQSYFSGFEYSANAKIILWNSILEKILKNNFQKKDDKLKEQLIQEMRVYSSDLLPIKDLIDIRNDIAHGDDVKSDRLFRLLKDWQILIERVLLQELKWYNLSITDVSINGIKPYGL
ncbi:hypothetical protein [Aliarcobacter butzleri]|uniref:hypothetical protein n=1 Tax=Aliarcobacter butzleri TaxID=28197 RepID=UPI003B223B56